jgi:hypothetical protein
MPTGKKAAPAIMRGRRPLAAQNKIDVSHAEYATASTTMIVAAVVKSIGPLAGRVIGIPHPARLLATNGVPLARRQSARGSMPIGLHHFGGRCSIIQATMNATSPPSPPAPSDRRSRSRPGTRASLRSPHPTWPYGTMPPSSNAALSSTVALQAHHQRRHIELCVR